MPDSGIQDRDYMGLKSRIDFGSFLQFCEYRQIYTDMLGVLSDIEDLSNPFDHILAETVNNSVELMNTLRNKCCWQKKNEITSRMDLDHDWIILAGSFITSNEKPWRKLLWPKCITMYCCSQSSDIGLSEYLAMS
jgi:hypothetical protein